MPFIVRLFILFVMLVVAVIVYIVGCRIGNKPKTDSPLESDPDTSEGWFWGMLSLGTYLVIVWLITRLLAKLGWLYP